MTIEIESKIHNLIWPAMPSPGGALALSLLYQMKNSQWWPAEVLESFQFKQFTMVLDHAYKTIPFYRERLDNAGLKPHEINW